MLELEEEVVSSGEISGVSEKAISEEIAERRTIVYKTLVDASVVGIIAEKLKSEVFVKFGLLKPKPHEVRCVSIEKFYEPFLAVNARYVVDNYREHDILFDVDNDVKEVLVGEQVFKPEPQNEESPVKNVTLPVSERITIEKKVYIIFDGSGNEIDPEKLPYAPSEEHPKKVLKEYKEKVQKLEMPPDAELELIRSRIVEETVDAEKTAWRSFEVSDRVLMYIPYYEIVFENAKTGETKTIKIDGITGNITS